MSRVRLLVVCLALCCVVAVVSVGSAAAEEVPLSSLSSSSTSSTSFSFSIPLVIEGSSTEAEQRRAAEEARLASPEAVRAREASELAYSGLSPTESKELAGRTFPALVNEPDGGAPKLPEGARISSFSSQFTAAVELPHGEHGTLESVAPIAVNTPIGTVPVDLTPRQAGSGFEASTPAEGMHVRAGGKLSEGASLSDLGITLTPVTENGTALEGNRSVDGASIFYGNSENAQAGIADTDSLIKFDTYGFSEETILRSDLAPQKLYFRVGLPEGASLVQAPDNPGSLQVVDAGKTIARVSAPSGRDAEGTLVPLTLAVSGDMVTLNVEHRPGQYKLPIEVDPTTYDTQVLVIHNGLTYQSRWKVGTSNGKEGPFHFSESPNFGIRDYHGENTSPEYVDGEWGGYAYTTQGESSIYDVHVTSSLTDEGHGFEARAQLTNKVKTGKNEPSASHLDSYSEGSWPGWALCMLPECAVPSEVTSEIEGNSYSLVQFATRTGNYTMNAELWGAWVYIVQTKNSTVSFDTIDSEIAGVPNALYGTEHWVRGAAGVVKGLAKDPGIGISELGFSSVNESKWGISESFLYPSTALCEGVICPKEETRTVNLSGLPDGKNTVTFNGQNATDTKAQAAKVSATVYVDNTAPHNIVLSGLPTTKEVGGGEYKLTAEATDGTAPTPSSGMKSMALLVDGKEVGSLATPCSPGPCTAHSGTWTIFGHNYATGRHTVTVQATDNAGNTSSEAFVMIVHPASPVSMGPGVVNPLSGELSLSATDVSMGGGLTVGRSYGSQHLTTGESGPVSAQWGFSLGSQESLIKQPDGSMVLTDASGAQTIFPSDGKGGYVSPAGDSNLTLSSSPCEAGQSEFMLRNAAAATTTCFKVPAGGTSEIWTPSIAKGVVATDTVTYAYERAEPHQAHHEYSLPAESRPYGITAGPDNNLWFADGGTNKIGKITTSGVITEYSLPVGGYSFGITKGPDGNLWYANMGAGKIGKITTSGAITEYSLPGKSAAYITEGSDHNLWFTGAAIIGKITTSGAVTEYPLPAQSKPTGITAGPDGNLWFANFNNGTLAKTIGKITTSGSVTEYSISGAAQGITSGSDGNVWYANPGNGKIGKITTAGAATEYLLPTESRPEWITAGPEGKLWFTDRGTSKVGSITTSGAVVEYSAGTNNEPAGITTGSDKNLWFAEYGTSKIAMLAPPEPGAKAIIEPTEALAPVPAGVSCSPELKPGCRALTFNYAESTTATGEAQSQWGDYNGHLTRVYYTAYDPVSKAMKTVEVAHYLYDNHARVRSEWDPRVSPALKTVYGYDSEGHVTSLTAPGQETWAVTYGTIGSDLGAGRALKTRQAPASASLWNGQATKNTEAPKLTGSAFVGTRMTVSDGTWTASPVLYGYQWERCNTSGKECAAIAGATNANYTPVTGDEGHTLVAQVTAANGGGSLSASSVASGIVKAGSGEQGAIRGPQPGLTIVYGVPLSGTGLANLTKSEVEKWAQKDIPTEATAVFPADEPQGWPASDYRRATLYYRDNTSRTVNVAAPGGGVSTSEYNEGNEVTRSLSADNRAVALKEGAKSAEVSQTLDTQSTYNTEGTELLSTLGPQHTIKLAAGGEVQARSHTVYYYDEGAPSEGGPYRVVTRMTQGAQFAGKEEDIRTTRTYYSGQKGLGWTLRKPTSVATDPAGLDLVHTTVYNETTGNVVETRAPGGTAETVYPPAFSLVFGSEGSGAGQFKKPQSVAIDSGGNLWVVDSGNDRIEKFSSSGSFIVAYGKEGSGNVQFKEPRGVSIDQGTGNIYVADTGNSRIEELNSSGGFVRAFGTSGSGLLSGPAAVTRDALGDVWVSDSGHNRVVEFSGEGVFIREFGGLGSGNGQFNEPGRLTISEGSLYVIDYGNARVEEFSLTGSYIGQFGSKGSGNGQFKEPRGITANPSTGNLYVSDTYNHRMQEFSPAGRFLAAWETWGPKHPLTTPVGSAVSATGKLYVADLEGGQVMAWTPPEAGGAHLIYASQFGSAGSGNGQFSSPVDSAIDGQGNIWVTDWGNNRVEKFSRSGSFVAAYGKEGSGEVQFRQPTGIDVNQSTGNVYVSDAGNSRIEELSSSGAFLRTFGTSGEGTLNRPEGLKIDSAGNVWVPDRNTDRVVEFSSTGTFIAAYGKEGSGEGQFNKPIAIAFSGENVFVADSANHRVEELSNKGAYLGQFGIEGSGSGELYTPEGITADSAGDLYVVDDNADHVEEFSANGVYRATFASKGSGEGQLTNPVGVSIDAAGDMYIVDTGDNRIEKWNNNNQAVHDTKTIYYTANGEAEVTACRNHPEWANLPCLTEPAAQPETENLPPLLVTTTTYNMYGEPLAGTSTSGSSTRTSTNTYDGAGRPLTVETTASTGTALPKVTDKYSETTGALVEQSTSTLSIKSVFNNLGQLTSYTDADGNISTLEYEPENAARLKKINDGKGIQTLNYDETTGQIKELIDSAAGTFTAGYDPEGNLTSEGYPNGMTATYTLNTAGEHVGLVYKKVTHCTEKCEWFVDSVVPSIHGQWLTQASSLGKDVYAYDQAGRLVESQVTPAGTGGCVTRRYAYDEDTNRTSLSVYQPNAKGECATEAGTTEKHTYDPADRLTDAGTSYDAFGNTTSLPAADAGGSELKSGFYVDNQLASQTQAGETIGYNLDPAGRTREIVSTGKIVASEVQHYAGAGGTPTWTGETSGNWRRNISTMTGLTAIQRNSEAPILQLSNLHGDIVATATTSETATGLASTIKEASDYGVPATETPPRFSWLGAHEIPTELPSGVATMGVRSYVPQLGRFLQTDPRSGGSANSYSYVFGDPINTNDLTGEYTFGFGASLTESLNAHGAELAQAYEAELRAEAERKAREAAQEAAMLASFETEGPEEEWEEEGEEGGEYAAWHHPAGTEHETGNTEEGLLFQPLGEEASQDMRTNLVAMCSMELHEYAKARPRGACMEYVDLFGEIVGGIEKAAKGGWHVIKHAARKVWHWVRTHANLVKQVSCGISGGGAGVLAGVGAGVFTENLYIGGSIGAAVASGVTYACEHQRHF
jgi:tripartite motif-containing protein 71